MGLFEPLLELPQKRALSQNHSHYERARTWVYAHTEVLDGLTPKTDIAGELRSTQVRIVEACCPADITSIKVCDSGRPDGLIVHSEFSCYLSEWSFFTAFAEVTTTGVYAFGIRRRRHCSL